MLSFNTTTKAVGAFQQLNLWEMQLQGFPLSIPDNVKFRVESISIPTTEYEEVKATINRFEITQPAHIKRNGTIDFSVTESDNAETVAYANELENALFSVSDKDAEGISTGWDSIKGTVIIYLLDNKGNKTQGYKLMDSFITVDRSNDLGSDAEVMKFKFTVHYNWWSFVS